MKCVHCETDYEMLMEVLAFKCSVCDKVNCLLCKTIHDVVCDVKPIILPAPQQPPSEALNALRAHKSYVAFPNNVEDQFGEQEIFNYRKRANTFVDVRPKPVAKPPKRRQTMQTVERVLCEACGESYSENYIKIHRGTKKHQKNSRKMKAANRL